MISAIYQNQAFQLLQPDPDSGTFENMVTFEIN